jgi:hypothetical protein
MDIEMDLLSFGVCACDLALSELEMDIHIMYSQEIYVAERAERANLAQLNAIISS